MRRKLTALAVAAIAAVSVAGCSGGGSSREACAGHGGPAAGWSLHLSSGSVSCADGSTDWLNAHDQWQNGGGYVTQHVPAQGSQR